MNMNLFECNLHVYYYLHYYYFFLWMAKTTFIITTIYVEVVIYICKSNFYFFSDILNGQWH